MCLLAHSLELIEQSIVEYLEVDPIIIPFLSSDLDRFMHLATDTRGLSLGDRMLAAGDSIRLYPICQCIDLEKDPRKGRITQDHFSSSLTIPSPS